MSAAEEKKPEETTVDDEDLVDYEEDELEQKAENAKATNGVKKYVYILG